MTHRPPSGLEYDCRQDDYPMTYQNSNSGMEALSPNLQDVPISALTPVKHMRSSTLASVNPSPKPARRSNVQYWICGLQNRICGLRKITFLLSLVLILILCAMGGGIAGVSAAKKQQSKNKGSVTISWPRMLSSCMG